MKFEVVLKVILPGLCGTTPQAEAISIENSLLSRRLNGPTHSGQHEKYFTHSNITMPSLWFTN
ncbi:MAG: hypothetical protein MUE59_16395 [Thiobacillaceae bacterium]|jgi:hypothetical protein|nr:hypothetical protein [Thiobacillaceae bacterium]